MGCILSHHVFHYFTLLVSLFSSFLLSRCVSSKIDSKSAFGVLLLWSSVGFLVPFLILSTLRQPVFLFLFIWWNVPQCVCFFPHMTKSHSFYISDVDVCGPLKLSDDYYFCPFYDYFKAYSYSVHITIMISLPITCWETV